MVDLGYTKTDVAVELERILASVRALVSWFFYWYGYTISRTEKPTAVEKAFQQWWKEFGSADEGLKAAIWEAISAAVEEDDPVEAE